MNIRPIFSTGASVSGRGANVYLPLFIRGLSGQYTSGGGFVNESQYRKKVLKPRSDVPFADSAGRISEPWDRYFDYLDFKLGGPLGPSLPDVVSNIEDSSTAINAAVANVAASSQQVIVNAQALAAAVEVIANSNLPGATQIPPVQITPDAPDVSAGTNL